MTGCSQLVEALERRTLLSVSFAPQQTYPTGRQPIAIAASALTSNGIIDLVTANLQDNTVSVLLGNGDGTFGPPENFPTGNSPYSVAVADLNNDGFPDIVTANEADNTVSVLRGNGDGTFKPAITDAVGNEPKSVAIADVNGDGIPDLVVTNYADNTVSVLLGKGNGHFQPQMTFPVGVRPHDVVVGDFGNNGTADLAVVNTGSGSVSILLGNGNGNGNGTFKPQQSYPIGGTLEYLAAADLNNDGKLDLIGPDVFDNSINVLLGNGDGTFQSSQSIPGVSFPGAVAVADFNGDGIPDLAATDLADKVSVLLGKGNGQQFHAPISLAVGESPMGIAVGDFNHDGRPDIAVANANSINGSVSILLNNTPGTLTQLAFRSTPASQIAGSAFTANVVVYAEDQFGNIVTSDNSSVTLGAQVFPAGETFTPVTVNAVNGVAKFKGVVIDVAGGYRLKATQSGLITAKTGKFYVLPAAASQLVFSPVSSGVSAGVALGPITVDVEDQFGNIETGDSSTLVTLGLKTFPAGVLFSSISIDDVDGAATFDNVILRTAGAYRFQATAPRLPAGKSAKITVS